MKRHPCMWGNCSEPGTIEYSGWGWLCAAHDAQNAEEAAAYERDRELEVEAEATEWQSRKEFAQAMYNAVLDGEFTPGDWVIHAARRYGVVYI